MEEVGSVYCELPGALLIIDPVVPEDAEDAARLWRALDRDVERLRRPVCVVVTVHWHRRGADEVIARYAALDGVVPDGATAIPLGDPIGETAYGLRHHGALVPGDIVLGGDGIEGERSDGPCACVRRAGTAGPSRSAGGTAAWACAALSIVWPARARSACSCRTARRS